MKKKIDTVYIVCNNCIGRFVNKNFLPYKATKKLPPDILPYDIAEELKKKKPSARFAHQYVQNPEALYERFVNPTNGRFGTGLLPIILDICKKLEYNVELKDLRQKLDFDETKINENIVKNRTLRDYQLESLKNVVEHQNLILKIPTGGGKTLTMAAITEAFKNFPSLIIVNKLLSGKQTAEEFVKFGISKEDIVFISSEDDIKFGWTEQNIRDKRIIIATIQTLSSLKSDYKDFFSRFRVVIVNEAHHSKGITYRKVLRKLENCRVRVGVSGTPLTGDLIDDWRRMQFLGQPEYELKTKILVERNLLSKPIIRFIELDKQGIKNLDEWNEIYEQGIVKNEERNKIIKDLILKLQGKTIVLFKNIEHGLDIARSVGMNVERGDVGYHPLGEKFIYYLDGETKMSERYKVIESYNKSIHSVIIASTIFDEDVDLPGTNNLILATGGKSQVATIQRLGRCLRPNDLNLVHVFDFFDKSHKMLENHSELRAKIWKNEGHDIQVIRLKTSK